ncbi:hypothetical protein ABZY02_34655 [Streptomyces sp. NPDC006649]|uniref:hypothetical protein n=1 Tax=Streptomyces sp. NPDC006649 TaxID=3156896 RepID=UPI0033AAE6EB
MMTVVVTAAGALAAGYLLLGRLTPLAACGRLGGRSGPLHRSVGPGRHRAAGRRRLVHVVTAPRTSWRIMRAPAADTTVPVPVRDPDWVANRTHHDKGGTP